MRTPWRLPKPFRYQSTVAGEPEVVEHRGVQQPRQIADRVQRAVGDGPRVLQRDDVDAGGFHRALRDGQFDLDRGQDLADFVVQLARDAAALLFLRGQELRRQPLEIARGLDVAQPLRAGCAARAGRRRASPASAIATLAGEREADGLPDAALRGAVQRRDVELLLHERAAVQALDLLGDAHARLRASA